MSFLQEHLGLGLVALFLASLLAVFSSAAEVLLLGLKRHRIPTLAGGQTNRSAQLADFLTDQRSQVALVLTLGCVANLSIILLILALGSQVRWPMENTRLFQVGAGLFFLLLIFSIDYLPKRLALARPRFTWNLIANPLAALSGLNHLVDPLIRLSDLAATRLLAGRAHPRKGLEEKELISMVRQRTDIGALNSSEGEMIEDVIRLSRKTVKDCATPRVKAFVLPEDLPIAERNRRLQRQPHHFVPVYKGTRDQISGIIDVRKALSQKASDCVSPPIFVSETMDAFEAFFGHLQEPHSVVVILDEYGGFEGLLSRSDIIDEIFDDGAPEGGHH
ncbi:MAG: CNNM domain-containing protein, partial [Verrucomicrobiota bacterium]